MKFKTNNIFYNVVSPGRAVVVKICSGVVDVVIPSIVEYHGEKFDVVSILGNYISNFKINSIFVPSSIVDINIHAFDHCPDLKEINVDPNNTNYYSSDGIIYIKKDNILFRCPPGKKGDIIIPSSVTALCEHSFEECHHITFVSLPDGIKEIPFNAFSYCNNLDNVVLPSSVTTICADAFDECSSLENIVIPSSVTSIGRYAFRYCVKLKDIYIPPSVISIGTGAFMCTPFYENKPDGLVYINYVLFSVMGWLPSGSYVSVREGTVFITDNAFYNSNGLVSVSIPSSVVSIGENAFFGCSSLREITLPERFIDSICDFVDCKRKLKINLI